jgi:ABC-type transporter Mla MlaB component
MQAQVESGSGDLVVDTEMTVYNAADLKSAFLAQTIVGRKLDLDLSQVRELDTAGIQLLLMLKRRSANQLRITSCSHAVRSALALCHLQDLLATDTPAEAA